EPRPGRTRSARGDSPGARGARPHPRRHKGRARARGRRLGRRRRSEAIERLETRRALRPADRAASRREAWPRARDTRAPPLRHRPPSANEPRREEGALAPDTAHAPDTLPNRVTPAAGDAAALLRRG